MATENTARLAVLIDADNAQPSITEGLLAEVAKYGIAHVLTPAPYRRLEGKVASSG
jgi:hypothetical protein